MTPITHERACHELRRAARLLGEEKISRQAWYESVVRILAARQPRAASTQLGLPGAPA